MFNDIYENKKVLITGHTGFKGSWLSVFLNKLGAEVIGVSLAPNTQPNHFSLLNVDILSETGDIRDAEFVRNVIEKHQPEIVFHLAAQALVRESYFNPLYTLETNVIGTANIFDACRKVRSVRAIVNITSDKCYENKNENKAFSENDRLGGYDIYSASKACSEIITNSFRQSFFNLKNYEEHGLLISSIRAGNVVGGGDWADDRIMPDIVRSIVNDEVLQIRNPNATRPWQHVLDPLSAYLLIGQKLLQKDTFFARPWNAASLKNEVHTVKELTERIRSSWNRFNYKTEKQDDLHEAELLLLDASEISKYAEWKNIWEFEDVIERTIQWYKAYYEENKVVTFEQLDEYIADAEKLNAVWIN